MFAINKSLNLHQVLGAQKITYQPLIGYYTIAIASVLKDYRLSFFINQVLHLQLEKVDDLVSVNKKKDESKRFSKFNFIDLNSDFEYFLIQNKVLGSLYIKEYKNFDFLLIIKTIDEESIDVVSLLDKIKQIKDVQLAMIISNMKPADVKLLERDF